MLSVQGKLDVVFRANPVGDELRESSSSGLEARDHHIAIMTFGELLGPRVLGIVPGTENVVLRKCLSLCCRRKEEAKVRYKKMGPANIRIVLTFTDQSTTR